MERRRKKRTFLEPKKLPVDFARDYIIVLRTLSRKDKDDTEAAKAVRLLQRMSKEAFLAGRGEVWIPSPNPLTGHYPVVENVPYTKVRTALRKNTKRRAKAWGAVASSSRPFRPLRSSMSHVEKSLLPAVMTAIPFKKGRYPALLGKIVPGELEMSRTGAQRGVRSLIPIKRMNPEEWSQGFQPLKFAFAKRDYKGGVHYARVVRYSLDNELSKVYDKGFQYGLRASWQRKKVGAFLKKHGTGIGTAIAGALVGGGIQKLHTEIGLPPTTVDLEPIQRTSMKREFQPYPSTQLRGFRGSLMDRLSKTIEGPTRAAIESQIGKINVELIQRGSYLGKEVV